MGIGGKATSGRLNVHFPRSMGHTPDYLSWRGGVMMRTTDVLGGLQLGGHGKGRIALLARMMCRGRSRGRGRGRGREPGRHGSGQDGRDCWESVKHMEQEAFACASPASPSTSRSRAARPVCDVSACLERMHMHAMRGAPSLTTVALCRFVQAEEALGSSYPSSSASNPRPNKAPVLVFQRVQ